MAREAHITEGETIGPRAVLGSEQNVSRAFSTVSRMILKTVGDVGATEGSCFQLPCLPYSFRSLRPQCDERLVAQHYYGYHARCVRVLNLLVHKAQHEQWQAGSNSAAVLSRMMISYGSDHALHCLFWNSLRPGGSGVPHELGEAMAARYGSIQAAMFYFASLCKTVRLRGWGVLAYQPAHDRLVMFHTGETVNLMYWPVVPLLVCDMWEHAYNLQYGRDAGKWVDNIMTLFNWEFVANRYAAARTGGYRMSG